MIKINLISLFILVLPILGLLDNKQLEEKVNEFNQLMREPFQHCKYEDNLYLKESNYTGTLEDPHERYCKIQIDRCGSLFCGTGGITSGCKQKCSEAGYDKTLSKTMFHGAKTVGNNHIFVLRQKENGLGLKNFQISEKNGIIEASIHYYRTDFRQKDGSKYPDYNDLINAKYYPYERKFTATELWPQGSRSGAVKEDYVMIFSEKWDRVEGGQSTDYFKDESLKTQLFGTGFGQLDYVRVEEKAKVDVSYQVCVDKIQG